MHAAVAVAGSARLTRRARAAHRDRDRGDADRARRRAANREHGRPLPRARPHGRPHHRSRRTSRPRRSDRIAQLARRRGECSVVGPAAAFPEDSSDYMPFMAGPTAGAGFTMMRGAASRGGGRIQARADEVMLSEAHAREARQARRRHGRVAGVHAGGSSNAASPPTNMPRRATRVFASPGGRATAGARRRRGCGPAPTCGTARTRSPFVPHARLLRAHPDELVAPERACGASARSGPRDAFVAAAQRRCRPTPSVLPGRERESRSRTRSACSRSGSSCSGSLPGSRHASRSGRRSCGRRPRTANGRLLRALGALERAAVDVGALLAVAARRWRRASCSASPAPGSRRLGCRSALAPARRTESGPAVRRAGARCAAHSSVFVGGRRSRRRCAAWLVDRRAHARPHRGTASWIPSIARRPRCRSRRRPPLRARFRQRRWLEPHGDRARSRRRPPGDRGASSFGAGLEHLVDTPALYGWAFDAVGVDDRAPSTRSCAIPMSRGRRRLGAARAARRRASDVRLRGAAGVGATHFRHRPRARAARHRRGRARSQTPCSMPGCSSVTRSASPGRRAMRTLRVVGQAVFLTDHDGYPARRRCRSSTRMSSSTSASATVSSPSRSRSRRGRRAGTNGSSSFGERRRRSHVPSPPAEIEKLEQVERLPQFLAGFLVLLGIVAIVHTLIVVSVRRGRRDLGVLRALGFRGARCRRERSRGRRSRSRCVGGVVGSARSASSSGGSSGSGCRQRSASARCYELPAGALVAIGCR